MPATTSPESAARPKPTNEPPRCLRVRSGDHWLMIDFKDVASAEPAPRPSSGDGQEHMLAVGWDSEEREPVPIWILADLLELDQAPADVESGSGSGSAPGSEGMIIVFQSTKRPWGVWVDDAQECEPEHPVSPLPLCGWTVNGKRPPFRGLISIDPGPDYFRPISEPDHLLLLDPRRLHPGSDFEPESDVETETAESDPSEPALFDALAIPQRGPSARRQILLFRVSPEQGDPELSPWLAVSGSQIVEIVETCRLTFVPLTAPHILGVVIWRGWPAAAVDLAAWLELPDGLMEERHRWIIARDAKGGLLAFPVSQIMRSLTLPVPSDPYPIPSYIPRERVRGGFVWEGQLLLAPDLNKIA